MANPSHISYATLATICSMGYDSLAEAVRRGTLTKAARGLVAVDDKLHAFLARRGAALPATGGAGGTGGGGADGEGGGRALPGWLAERLARVAHEGLRGAFVAGFGLVPDFGDKLAVAEAVWAVAAQATGRGKVGSVAELADALGAMDLPYARCESEKYLYRKLATLRDAGAMPAVSVKNGRNQNALVMTDMVRYFVEYIVAGGMNPTGVQVAQRVEYVINTYNSLYAEEGSKPLRAPSARTVEAYLAEPEVRNRLRAATEGAKKGGSRLRQFLPRYAPAAAHALWEVDSTRLQVRYIGQRNGRAASMFASITVVADIHSRAIIGWALAGGEEKDAVRRALQMAVANTGYLPYEILTDNGPAMTHPETETLMRGMAVVVRRARVGNAQDKRIERVLFSFQDQSLRLLPAYIGGGVKDRRKGAHPTDEAMDAAWKNRELPTADDLPALVAQAVAVHNAHRNMVGRAHDHMSRIQRLADTDHNARPATPEDAARLFWPKRQETARNGYLRVIHAKAEHFFVVPTEWRLRLEGVQATVAVDTANLAGGIWAWLGTECIGLLPLQDRAAGDAASRSGRDWQIMGQVADRNAALGRLMADEAARLERDALAEHMRRLGGSDEANDPAEAAFVAKFPFAQLNAFKKDGRGLFKATIEAAEDALLDEAINKRPTVVLPPLPEEEEEQPAKKSIYDLPFKGRDAAPE